MTQIDLTMVVDAVTLLGAGSASHDPEQPTEAAGSLLFMVTGQNHTIAGSPNEALHLSVNSGDTIRWQAAGANVTPAYTVAIYQFASLQAEVLFSTPQLNVPDIQSFYPTKASNPLEFSPQQVHAPYWSLSAQKAGTTLYRLSFAVLQSSSPTPLGYYSTDIQLSVTQPRPAKTINVMALIDPTGLPAPEPIRPQLATPTEAPASSIFLVTAQSSALAGNGSAELLLSAAPGDTICWQAAGLPLATVSTIALYDVRVTRGQDLLSAPQIVTGSASYPVPNPANPADWEFQAGPISYWTANAVAAGAAVYRLSFAVLDSQQQLKGYYHWHARIMLAATPDQNPDVGQNSLSEQGIALKQGA